MKVRGNIIKARHAFVQHDFGDAAWEKVLSSLSADDQKVLRGIIIHSAWYDFDVATRLDEAIVNVLGFLNDRDIFLTSLEILEPNLESVFLHLTGKKLRE